jgi:CRISPR/Cas system Type II protein with McrA/HNH and RuvC-like nuclease domain
MLPILLKTLDFLFGEGSKILQERRERRNTPSVTEKVPKIEESKSVEDHILSKEKALSIHLKQSAWLESENEIKHLLSLLEIYSKNYYLAKEQYATFGRALVPQVVVYNLAEAEDGVETTIKKLKTVLGKVYGQELSIPGID